MADKIRWGVLSTANIGRRRVIPAIQQSSNGIVAGVASRDVTRAREFADGLGIEKAYGSYEELINDPEIDAIYNPLPNAMHAEWSIKCAEAGKPTLCEKPLASDAAEAQTMVDAFSRHGVLFAEAFMYRFHPQTVKVKQMVDDGAVGDLHTLSAAFTFALGPGREDDIRLSQDLAGGSLMDVGCYCINVIRLMVGKEPTGAKGFSVIGEHSGVDERSAGVLEFEGGVLAHFDSGLRTQYNHKYEIRGSKGKIVVEEGFVMAADKATKIRYWENVSLGRDNYHEIIVPPANSYTYMAEDFAAALLDNRPPRYLPQDAVQNMQVIDRLKAN